MSASREKQNRQARTDLAASKTAREAQQRKEEKRSNILYGVIAVVFVAVLLVSIVWRSNVIPRMSTAATIDGEKYTAADVSFYYQNAYSSFVNQNYYFLNYIGLNTSTSLREQTITETAAAMMGQEYQEGQTWHDYFVDRALEQMAAVKNALAKAESEGFTYPAGIQKQYEDSMASLEAAASTNSVSVQQYLAANYGSSMTEKVYGQLLTEVLKYDAYTSAYSDSLTYDDAKLTETYEANRNSYDNVSYESISISGAAESTTDGEGNTVEPTEDEEAAAKAAAKETADSILADFESGKSLESLSSDENSYTENESATYTGGVVSEWLFDDARKEGDSAVLESGSTYYVVVFRSRYRNEEPTIDVRHILIQPESGTLAEGDDGYEEEQAQLKADAKAKADDLLAQWKAGEATEDSFAALALENSADGSKYDGGIISGIYSGSSLVTSFKDWCLDSSRKPGDTDVVESEYGYHIMYFVGEDLPVWKENVANTLKNEDYNEWAQALSADAAIDKSGSGMKFVG